MSKKIQLIIASVIIIATVLWAFNLVWQRSYNGSNLTVKVGGGQVLLTNPGQDVIPIQMKAEGRTSSFRIESQDLDLRVGSKREGSGSNAYHAINFDLPPGQARVDVTWGTKVELLSKSNQRLTALVTPVDEGLRELFVVAGLIILATLYYISRIFKHRWIRALFDQFPKLIQRLKKSMT